MLIVLDTNFIISFLKSHRDIDEEIRTAVPGPASIVVQDLVLFELERLSRKGTGSIRMWANAAISFLTKRHYPILEHKSGPTDVDALLVQFSLVEKAPIAIATIDSQLRKVLASFNIATITPNRRHGLAATSFHA